MIRCNFDKAIGLPLILENFHRFMSLIAMVNNHYQWPSPIQQFIKCKRQSSCEVMLGETNIQFLVLFATRVVISQRLVFKFFYIIVSLSVESRA